MSIEDKKILVVEDNPGDRRLVEEWFKNACFRAALVTAEDLNQALIRLSESAFELILLDLGLPDSEGLETFRKVSAHAGETPVIVVTGLSDEELGIRAVHEGAADYLVKGELDHKALMRSIRYSIERKRLEKELREKVRELERVNRILAFGRDMEIEELRKELVRLHEKR